MGLRDRLRRSGSRQDGSVAERSHLAWDKAQLRLMPAVRAASGAAAPPTGASPALRWTFAPFLLLLTAIDDEHASGRSFVSEDDLRRWRVGAEEVGGRAMANLADSPVPVGQRDEGCLELLGPDRYVSSWLALPDALLELGAPLGDDIVVLAPSQDSLRMVATKDRTRLAAELNRALEQYRNDARPLSPVPYAVSHGAVSVWSPENGDPLRASVDRAQGVLAATEYGSQQAALDDRFARSGDNVFVARFRLVERADGTVWSWAAWLRDVSDGLLPRVDIVCMSAGEEQDPFWVCWEDAERVASDALRREPGHFPALWRVHGWPSDGALRELRELAVDPGTA